MALPALAELIRSAPAEVLVLGLLAVVVGALGLIWSCLKAVVYWRASVRLVRVESVRDTPIDGVFDVLGVLVKAGEVRTALSPDAAWVFVSNRLASDLEPTRAVVRFSAQLPLLIGVAATVVGLAGLLPELSPMGVNSASTGLHVNLQGVLAGTLLGIIGSIVGSIGGLVLSAGSKRLVATVEDYVHAHILSRIPERHIGVRIEEAVLRVIAERSEVVVATFRDALLPVAAELSTTATTSASAARIAADAFGDASRALKDAGSLAKAASTIGKKLDQIGLASESLGAAATTALEAAKLQDRSRDSLSESVRTAQDQSDRALAAAGQVARSFHEVAEALAAPVQGIRESVAAMSQAAHDLRGEIGTVSTSFGDVARAVDVRNDLEQKRLEDFRDRLQKMDDPLARLVERMSNIQQELAAARDAIEGFKARASQGINATIEAEFLSLARKLDTVFSQIAGVIPAGAAKMEDASRSLLLSADELRQKLSGIEAPAASVVAALERYSEGLNSVSKAIDQSAQLIANQAGTASPTGTAGPHEEWGTALTQLTTAAADLRRAASDIRGLAATPTAEAKPRFPWPFR